MMKPRNDYIVFLPWVGFREEFAIGPFILWPYDSLSRHKIQDNDLLGVLDRYFKSFVDQKDNVVNSIVVCSFQNSVIQNIDDHHYSKIRKIVDALTFSQISIQTKWSVLRNNRTMGPPGADLFELIADTYYPNKQDISFYSGSILHTGWQIGEIKFRKPWYVGSTINIENKDILTGLGKLSEIDTTESNRIFTSLEWYRLAHTEVDQISPFSKAVMMTTAFELLLEIPQWGKRIEFAKRIEENIAVSNMLKGDWVNPDSHQNEPKTLAFLWAYEFYKLRNKIVHGDNTSIEQLKFHSPNIDWLSQLIVADLVFSEILVRKMFSLGLCGDAVRETIEIWEPTEETRSGLTESVLDMHYDFNEVHQVLGWAPKTSRDESEVEYED